jgi:translation initiation factor IF-3
MISPEADPPVCRIVDYSKFKYEQTLKAKEAQKKMASARQDQKELKMRCACCADTRCTHACWYAPRAEQLRPALRRYNIDTHDYEVRLRAAQRFLKDGDKVKVLCQFRGREMEFKSIAVTLFERFIADCKEEGTCEGRPNIEGRSMIMVLAPLKADAQAKPKPAAPKPAPAPAAAAAAAAAPAPAAAAAAAAPAAE